MTEPVHLATLHLVRPGTGTRRELKRLAIVGSGIWTEHAYVQPQDYVGRHLEVHRTIDGRVVPYTIARSVPHPNADGFHTWQLARDGWHFAEVGVFGHVHLDASKPGWQPGDRVVVVPGKD